LEFIVFPSVFSEGRVARNGHGVDRRLGRGVNDASLRRPGRFDTLAGQRFIDAGFGYYIASSSCPISNPNYRSATLRPCRIDA
jgi:hypothetical protein